EHPRACQRWGRFDLAFAQIRTFAAADQQAESGATDAANRRSCRHIAGAVGEARTDLCASPSHGAVARRAARCGGRRNRRAARRLSLSDGAEPIMTALVRDDAVVVPVALGSRSYEIVIGRGVIATLGTRIAALRPGAKVFIVSDENAAAHAMAAAQTALKQAGIASGHLIVSPGESSKSYRVFEQVCEAI